MPIYDFQCDVCGHTEEFLCGMGELYRTVDDFVYCPVFVDKEKDTRCSGKMQRLLSAPVGIKVTGEGAYNNNMVCRSKK